MTEPTSDLRFIRKWHDTEGRELNQWGEYDWPSPPEYTEYAVEGAMREQALRAVEINADRWDGIKIRLIDCEIEGGYSEYTVEMDYDFEVWFDEDGQSQRMWTSSNWSRDSVMASFIAWLDRGAS